MKKVTLFCDGSSLGNPGAGGWCAILYYKHHQKILSGGASNVTNNQMELSALIFGLESLKESCEVLVISDSKYVLDTSVVSASGFLQDVKDAPATINVISKEELSTKPYRDITEAIADIPGVDLFASKGKTGNYNITMRGITGYTLILVDGRRQGVGGEVGPNGFNEISNAFLICPTPSTTLIS